MRVTFESQNKITTTHTNVSRDGQTLLDVARNVGVEVVTTCGGRGRCRSCRVKILKGDVPPATDQDYTQLGQEEVSEQFRLACQTKVIAACSVLVAPPASEVGHQIFISELDPEADSPTHVNSGIEQHFSTATSLKGIDEPVSDSERVLAELPAKVSNDLSLAVLRELPSAIRQQKGQVTLTTFNGSVIAIEPGDTRACRYGMAFDVGTTTIVGTLLDLVSGKRLASVANVNPQTIYGGDLMSRIAFVQSTEKNLATLKTRVLQTLNDFIIEACRNADIAPQNIYKITIVANPCMHHILLGINVSQLGFAPYAPVVRNELLLSARELPLKAAPQACIYLLPLIAGFVGSDAVGALLATRIDGGDGTRLLVDIGTNTEVIMATGGELVACSAPAGPAFEGGQIRHGMRAALGAIEGVEIGNDVRCEVIGNTPAIGICGSGLIDAVASMLDADLIEPHGRLMQSNRSTLPAGLRNRFLDNTEDDAFVLVHAEQSGRNEAVILTQSDIRQLQLAKGAIYSAITMLQRVMNVKNDEIDEILLCGGFGNYINLESALRIRMLPSLPCGRIRYVGNAALAGAEMVLVSESARSRALELTHRVKHISLTEQPDYQDIFVDALDI